MMACSLSQQTTAEQRLHLAAQEGDGPSLLAALNAGQPGSAAIDVFDEEPITWKNDPLATHPNLIATPHIGFVTEDEFELQFSDIFDQVVAFENGAPIHMINPSVLD